MQFHFAEATRILTKTMPYLLLRTAIYSLIGLAAAVYLGLVVLISKVFGGGGAVVFLIGLAILVGLLRMLKQYVLYLVNAGHIAVITQLIDTGALPENVSQFQYGKAIVTNLFKEVSVLFVFDRLVDGILRAFNRTVAQVADLLPIPGLEGLTKIVNSIINFSLTYVDETILSYSLSRKDENIWESSKRGVILYAQNWKPILTTAAASAVANFVGFVALFLILLIPFGPLAMMTRNETLKFFWLALAFTLAYGLKLSVFNPFFQVSMILTFRSATAGQEPNREWESRLEMASDKFRELQEKAAAFVRGGIHAAAEPVGTDQQPIELDGGR
jgi:hypothetical protein